MLKLRLFFVASLLIAGALIARVFIQPLTASTPEYAQVSRESLIKTADGWILQFDIINIESQDAVYVIDVSVNGKPYQDSFRINPEGVYTYIHQISSSEAGGEVSVEITKDGDLTPFQQETYQLG